MPAKSREGVLAFASSLGVSMLKLDGCGGRSAFECAWGRARGIFDIWVRGSAGTAVESVRCASRGGRAVTSAANWGRAGTR